MSYNNRTKVLTLVDKFMTYSSDEVHGHKLIKALAKSDPLVKFLFNNYVQAQLIVSNKVKNEKQYNHIDELVDVLAFVDNNELLYKAVGVLVNNLPLNKENASEYESYIKEIIMLLSDDQVDAYWNLKELFFISYN